MGDTEYWNGCIAESWEELIGYCVVIALAIDDTHLAEDYKKRFSGAVLAAVQIQMGREKARAEEQADAE